MNMLDRIYYSKPYQVVAEWRLSRKNVKAAKPNVSTHITPEQRRQVLEYYKPYARVNTIFHDFYTEKTGVFDVRFIPDDFYWNKIEKYYNNWHDAPILENKCFFRDMFSGIRQPEIFAYRMDNYWFMGDRHPISFRDLIAEAKNERELVVKKAAESAGGHGVFFVSTTEKETIEEALARCIERINGDIMIQYPIRQHEVMNQINRSSVNTVRILSLLQKDNVKIYSTIIRAGGSNSRTDNVSGGGFCCGVNPDGRLTEKGKFQNGDSITKTPSSGLELKSIVIPGIDEARKMACESAWRVPRFRLASWDIAIDNNGLPVLVEANLSYGGIVIHQMNNGPIFGEDTEKILREVFGK